MIENELLFTGVQVNYYFVCKRKLWLFSHNIGMEKESEAVKIRSYCMKLKNPEKWKSTLLPAFILHLFSKEKRN